MVQQYIDIYNDRWNGRRQTVQQFSDFRSVKFVRDLKFKITPRHFKSRYGDITGSREVREEQNGEKVILVKVPVDVESRENEALGGTISFHTEF